jgi:hypothetical protein
MLGLNEAVFRHRPQEFVVSGLEDHSGPGTVRATEP